MSPASRGTLRRHCLERLFPQGKEAAESVNGAAVESLKLLSAALSRVRQINPSPRTCSVLMQRLSNACATSSSRRRSSADTEQSAPRAA